MENLQTDKLAGAEKVKEGKFIICASKIFTSVRGKFIFENLRFQKFCYLYFLLQGLFQFVVVACFCLWVLD